MEVKAAKVWPGLAALRAWHINTRCRYGLTRGAGRHCTNLHRYWPPYFPSMVLILRDRKGSASVIALSSCSWFVECLWPNVRGPNAVPKVLEHHDTLLPEVGSTSVQLGTWGQSGQQPERICAKPALYFVVTEVQNWAHWPSLKAGAQKLPRVLCTWGLGWAPE